MSRFKFCHNTLLIVVLSLLVLTSCGSEEFVYEKSDGQPEIQVIEQGEPTEESETAPPEEPTEEPAVEMPEEPAEEPAVEMPKEPAEEPEAGSPEDVTKTPVNVPDNETAGDTQQGTGLMEVHYIDVGQGDAALIVCGGEAMLVDAGDESKGTAIQLYLKKHNTERLKYVVATHPDADHIGGIDVIIYKFDCGQILIPNCSNDTPSFEQLQDVIKVKGYTPHVVDVGEQYTLGDARIEILSPSREFFFSDTNDSSIVFRLDHGDNSFLFTGDATIPPQQALIYDPDLDIDVDVIKIPHHGAASAYIKGFYDEVSPEYAVISCGRDNRYGHPRQEVLDDLRNRGTKLFRTDEQGTIVAISDGTSIKFNTDPSDDWRPGDIIELKSTGDDAVVPFTREYQNDMSDVPEDGITYVYNSNTHKFHYPDCPSVLKMKPKNRVDFSGTREELISTYPEAQPCGNCKP